jgi:signal transduction histidine kinase/CheY-like chemotaxis protein
VSLPVLAAIYFGAAKLGLAMAVVAEQVSAVWPPTGIALAAVILCGHRVWPGIALGAFLANATAHEPPWIACGIATGNTLEAIVGAWLLRRLIRFDPALGRVTDALGLVVLAAALSTMVSATIGVTSLCAGGVHPWSAYFSLWSVWWLGDAMGALVMAPLVLAWGAGPRIGLGGWRLAEGLGLVAGLVATTLAVFGGSSPSDSANTALVYIVFPFVIWAALRFGPSGATLVAFVTSAIAITGTVNGFGPFAKAAADRLVYLQLFMAVVAVTGLCLGAAIAERSSAEESLREADRRKDDFLAVLAHELRNPLGPIRNAVHYLRLREPAEPDSQQAQAMIERQVTHMARLIDDLLDVSRIARGRILLKKERIDLVQVVDATIKDYRGGLEAAGLDVNVRLPAHPVWMPGDETRLAQVVGNLLQNAVKFCDEGCKVAVELDAEDGATARLTIADTGIGMASDLVARLFAPFTQADQSLGRSMGGLGLGLALAKGLIELHGGSIEAKSEGIGRGSQFTLHLPLERAPATSTLASAPRPHVGKPRRVLVVDDNRDAAESMRRLLRLAGHEADIAHTGCAGVERARQLRPEVVVCDIGLPGGMTGYDVARTLRGDPELASAYLIALTGYGQSEHHDRASAAGFDQFLTKPVNFDLLQTILTSMPPGQRAHA